jgi:hypothetical protein
LAGREIAKGVLKSIGGRRHIKEIFSLKGFICAFEINPARLLSDSIDLRFPEADNRKGRARNYYADH